MNKQWEQGNEESCQIKNGDCLLRVGRVGGSVGGGFAPPAAQERAKVAGARAIGRVWQSGSEARCTGRRRPRAGGCGVDIADMRRRVLRETLIKVFEAHD